MRYVNTSYHTVQKIHEFNHNLGEDKNFIKRHVATRCVNLALIPATPIMSVIDGIIGTGAGVANLLSGGLNKDLAQFTFDH